MLLASGLWRPSVCLLIGPEQWGVVCLVQGSQEYQGTGAPAPSQIFFRERRSLWGEGGCPQRRPCPGITAFPTEFLIPCDLELPVIMGIFSPPTNVSFFSLPLSRLRRRGGGLGGGRGVCWGETAAAKARLGASRSAGRVRCRFRWSSLGGAAVHSVQALVLANV